MSKISTPLRYPGGKSRALRKILPRIPLDFDEYREPFLGGGSVFIAVKQEHPNAIYKINDLNPELCCFWRSVRDNPDQLIRGIIKMRNSYRKGRRLYDRLHPSESWVDEIDRAIRFYILNRITYSGTVDSGGYSSQSFERKITLSRIDKLRSLSDLLQNVTITDESYEALLHAEGRGVFLYLDPPYWKSRRSRLYGKNGDLHKSFDHVKFAEDVKKCNHRWLITYDDSGVIRTLFSFARVNPWRLQYGMNNINGTATKGEEVLISNYELSVRQNGQ